MFFENKNYGFISQIDLKQKRIQILYSFIMVFGFLIIILCIFPPLWVILSSLKDTKEFYGIPATIIPRSFNPEKLWIVWNSVGFTKYFINSLIVVFGSVVCAMLFNGMLAYAVSILKPKGSKVVFNLVVMSMMIPTTVSMMTLFKNIVDVKLLNSYIPLMLGVGANAYFCILYKQFFDAIPKSYIEAARIDGCSKLKIFTHIITPMSKAVNTVITIFALNAAWSDFLMPYLILRKENVKTVMVKLFSMSTFPDDYIVVSLFFTIVPPVILFSIFQKNMINGIQLGGIKG
ncbi:carbohydrate ABC transporter permease [Vallitalea okinawensis]|uniref:carbohydrate ABC transporter permease n=1 Tax=Vallitalea okinawensis TaxID=2078660 RepID=UPI000CFC289C|nr:carbohydrate ABC transporter permease [Vallitalea okinawensis]